MQYNVCAIIICVIILFTHLTRKKTKEYHNLVFTAIVVITLIGAISNIANTMGNMKLVDMDQTLLVFWDYVYFFTLNLPPFLFAVYAVCLVRNNVSRLSLPGKLLLYVPEIAAIGTLLSNHWTQWYFYYKDGIYQRGTCQMILYIIDLYFIAFGVIYVFLSKKETSRATKFSVCAFLVIGYVTALIQLLNPPLLLMHLGMAVCDLALLLNLQRSEEYLNSELGIFNRRILERMLKRGMAAGTQMNLLLVHIEDLKFIIHNFGPERRSELLQQVAQFLDRISGENVYYYDSGTFVMLTLDVSGKKQEEWEQAIRERFQTQWELEEAQLLVNYKTMRLSMPGEISDLDTFYFCNSEFSDRVPDKDHVVSVQDIDFKRMERNIRIEKIIRRAIAEDHFQVYYQPIYSMEKDRITSAEALLRLIDPEEGFIPPDEFIPIAEKNGTILQIGDMVFEKVFRFMKEQQIEKMGIEYIEINLSVVQCMQKDLADSLLAMLERCGIGHHMVNLEITETAAIDSPKILLKNMQSLSEQGISFSMDDFGTGYSNISSIMSLPMNIIKLDKSLIDLAATQEKGSEVLDGIAAMIKRMGLKIVAEGIEEKEQVEQMRAIGIDYIQGYYFSRPLPEAQFMEYLKEKRSFGL